jgi:hypothetical protein
MSLLVSLFFALLFLTFFGGDVLFAVAVRRSFSGSGRVRFARRAIYAFLAMMAVALGSMMLGRLIGLRAEGVMPRPLLVTVFVWHFVGLTLGFVVGAGVVVMHLVVASDSDPSEQNHSRASRR